MENARWEAWAELSFGSWNPRLRITFNGKWISERELVLESIKGKHLYHTNLGNNYMLNPQHEEKIQVIETPFLHKEPESSDLKLQETLFFISNFSYYFWLA